MPNRGTGESTPPRAARGIDRYSVGDRRPGPVARACGRTTGGVHHRLWDPRRAPVRPGRLGSTMRRLAEAGMPGEFPFTRGLHPTMYRARPWDFAARSSASEPRWTRTGVTSSSWPRAGGRGRRTLQRLGSPDLVGLDSDDPRSRYEGRVGVAIDTIHDMEDLFEQGFRWTGSPRRSRSTTRRPGDPRHVRAGGRAASRRRARRPRRHASGTTHSRRSTRRRPSSPPARQSALLTDVVVFWRHMPNIDAIAAFCG